MTAPHPLSTDTITFLFTDIEGSTQLWEQQPAAMRTALAQHDCLLRQMIEDHHGHVFKTMGDAFCAAFPVAPEALKAALAIQYQLQTPLAQLTLKVRMALHTDAVEARAGDYFGPPINRVARLLAAGHGGQILLSRATQDLVRDYLPLDTLLRDLGEHRLKDLVRPEHVFQCVAPGLPTDFPPLKTLNSIPNNLPIQLTSFIGREPELAELQKRLGGERVRLLTLVGPGGTGKTRLSLQVAAHSLHAFAQGAWFVELAPVFDSTLVLQTVANALGVREQPRQPLQETLLNYLREKNLLLILDNCEHVLMAVASLAETLLRVCPDLQILASSREALNVAGEIVYRVPPLNIPDPSQLPTLPTLSQYEAVRLFIERAQTVLPSFTVTNQNAPALAQICHQLDGIPLAIELAAARVKVLSVKQIAGRLVDAFHLLTGGSRTALPRQQTLRALIDWSYVLLSERERTVFQRLAVFVGSWSLAAAEVVCADAKDIAPEDVLDLLTQLVDKSLVLAVAADAADAGHPPHPRYRLLEVVRQYAREKLNAAGEGEPSRNRHLAYYLDYAEAAEPHLFRAEQLEWLARLEWEHDNLRAALDWALSGDRAEPPEAGLRLANALWRFWLLRSSRQEGREWLARALAHPTPQTVARARALGYAAFFELSNNRSQGAQFAEESLALAQALDDQLGLAYALRMKGYYTASKGPNATNKKAFYQESLNRYQALGHVWGCANLHVDLGQFAQEYEYDLPAAGQHYTESLRLGREIGERRCIAYALNNLGTLALDAGDWSTAQTFFEESVGVARELHDKIGLCIWLGNLSEAALGQNNYPAALQSLEERLAIAQELGEKVLIGRALSDLGRLARLQGNHARAAQLQGESLTWVQGLDNKEVKVWALYRLGELARLQQDWATAHARYSETLALAQEIENRQALVVLLEEIAALSAARLYPTPAATLFSAAAALRQFIHVVPLPVERAEIEHNLAVARAQLPETTFAEAWAAGRALPLEAAVAYAQQLLEESL